MAKPKGNDWQAKFLGALRADPAESASGAAKVAGVHRVTVYDTAEADPDFKAAWEEAKEHQVDAIEKHMIRLAVGHEEKGNPTLLIFALKNRRKKVYGENQFDGEAPQSITVSFNGRPDAR